MKKFKNLKPVKDMRISKGISVDDLITRMLDSGGFTAKKLAVGTNILERMLKDKDCLKFLSFPACIIATGTRGVVKEMVRRKMFDVVITTCGTLDHDLARVWKDYYHGSFLMDDRELHKKGINRLGNVLVPNECYGSIIEEKMKKFLEEIYREKRELATYELVWEIGRRIKSRDSIVYWTYKNKIPMIIPGITDGAVGYQLWQFSQDHDFKIDALKDEKLLSDLIWNAKRSGALIIGGGISKHHVIWWNQFKDGLDYAVYITTAVEWDGSLSGARTREAISWGKIKETAKHVTIEGDATVYLPLIFASLVERLE
jgi:deoxyhypusine synthase